LIITMSISAGASVMSRIGYVRQSTLVTLRVSNLTSSHSVRLVACTAEDECRLRDWLQHPAVQRRLVEEIEATA